MEFLNNRIKDLNNSGTRRIGERGKCCVLNGTNQAIRVADNTALNITDNLTVCIWVKNDLANLSSDETIAGKYNSSTDRKEWRLRYTTSKRIRISLGNPSDGSVAWYADSTSTININSYQFIAFTFESGTVKLYLNGTQVGYSTIFGSIPATLYNGTQSLVIGAVYNSSNLEGHFDGNIMDFRIYSGESAALTESQLSKIYDSPTQYINFYQQELKAHYKLDDDAGVIANDSSGNFNQGIIQSAVSNWGTQDLFSFQNQLGFTLAYQLAKQLWTQEEASNITEISFKIRSKDTDFTVFNGTSAAAPYLLFVSKNSTSNELYTFVGDNVVITVDGVVLDNNDDINCTRGDLFNALCDGNFHEVNISGLDFDISEWDFIKIFSYILVLADYTTYLWDLTSDYGTPSDPDFYLPRDESNKRKNILGSDLTYSGKRPNDAELLDSNCVTANGTLYISAPHLTGTETVTRSGGTSTPSISSGRIDLTSGTCWDLLLSDGTHYPMAEGWGVDLGDVSGEENHATIVNGVLSDIWANKQSEYFYNLFNGHTIYEHPSTAFIRWPYYSGSAQIFSPPTGYTKKDDYPADSFNYPENKINFNPDSTPELIQLGSYSVPSTYTFGNLVDYTYEQAFKRTIDFKKEDRFLFFKEPLTGSALTEVKEYNDFAFNGNFVSVWKTNNAGTSASNQITLPLVSSGSYNMTVDWGDGTTDTITSYNQSEVTHTYYGEGTYLVSISGSCQGWQFDNGGDKEKILFINNWGCLDISTDAAFYGCVNLNSNATDSPTISTTSLKECFRDCVSLKKGVSGWNVGSNVTNLSYTFDECAVFNDDISSWNVSNVTAFIEMLKDCQRFNQDISGWNVSSGTSFIGMFRGASEFNQDIGSWNTSNATRMDYMFRDAIVFNQDIGSWDVSSVQDMYQMFNSAESFDQDLSSWDIRSCTDSDDLELMFIGATLSTANYDALLIGWESYGASLQTGSIFHGGHSTYTAGGAAEAARTSLSTTYGWIITDGGPA
jgi:surface protein